VIFATITIILLCGIAVACVVSAIVQSNRQKSIGYRSGYKTCDNLIKEGGLMRAIYMRQYMDYNDISFIKGFNQRLKEVGE